MTYRCPSRLLWPVVGGWSSLSVSFVALAVPPSVAGRSLTTLSLRIGNRRAPSRAAICVEMGKLLRFWGGGKLF